MKLIIENFQSLEGKNELNFEPGVTMIVGSSNSGKTALQRALRALILNYVSSSKAKKYITHFQDHFQVDLQLEDPGIIYSLNKTEKSTQYNIIDPEGNVYEFEKAGNDDIYSICEKAPIELGVQDFPFILRDKKLINTYTEKDGLPFPFDLNDVEMFKMFEELYNVSSSSIIFKFMKSLETKTNSQIKTTQENIAKDKEKIEKIINLEDKYDLDELDVLKVRAEKIQAGMLGIDDDIKTAAANNKTSKKIKGFLEQIENIKPIEDKAIEKGIDLLKESKDLAKDIKQVISNNEIEQINIYKKEFNTALIEDYNAFSSDYNKANKLAKEIKDVDSQIEELKEEQKQIEEELAKIEVCPLCKQPLKGEHKHE